MKIQIDTNAKTIKLESCEKLSALFDFLTKFFPDGEWEDYELQTNTNIVNWGSPIIVQPSPIWVNPYRYYTGDVFCGMSSDIVAPELTTGGNTLTISNTTPAIASECVLNFEMN